MAKRMVLSRMVTQPAVRTRSGTGLALTFNPAHPINAPVLYKYGYGFHVKDNFPTHSWCLCIELDDSVMDSSLASDPDILPFPLGWKMDRVLTGGQANSVNSDLAQTDLGITVTAGETVHDMVNDILVSLNHTPGAVDTIIL